jgi:hypothetical protein
MASICSAGAGGGGEARPRHYVIKGLPSQSGTGIATHQRTVSMLLKLSKAFIKVVKYRKITIFMTPNVNEYIGTSRWLNDLK